ncbi:unnamed protein product [Boreogadus saida]
MEDIACKRSKNFSKQELEVMVDEIIIRKRLLFVEGVDGGVDTGEPGEGDSLQAGDTLVAVAVNQDAEQSHTFNAAERTQALTNHQNLLQSPGDDLTLSQLFSDTFHTPDTSRSNTEDMVSLQRQLLEEVKMLRHTQEQLLQVEREKLLVEREKLRLAQAKFDLKKKKEC